MAEPATVPASLEPTPDDESWVDDALAPFSAYIASLLAIPDPSVDESTGQSLYVESLRLSMPFEMDTFSDGTRVLLAGGPPTQYTETTIMPVFHQLRVTIEADPLSPNG